MVNGDITIEGAASHAAPEEQLTQTGDGIIGTLTSNGAAGATAIGARS